MNIESLRAGAFALLAGIVLLAASAFASADPPSQVIRLGYTTGAVSFSPAGDDDWVRAALNRPLTIGDRLWVDSGARAELQVGGAMLRLNGPSGVTVLNLEDNFTQLQLTQGAMNVRVRRLDPDQVIEVDTPNLAFTMRQPGSYRIVVDTEGNTTDAIVRNGRAEVYGDGASYVIDSRQSYRFYDTTLRDYEQFASPSFDDFDRWASDRDRRYDTSVSARYVSPDVIGYQDLDAYGTWRTDPSYGNVWIPTRVESSWAPYRDGHWAWVDPWGWTWVDDAPWGFAVSHYGRWANLGGTWGWVPGPMRTRAYYAPALVAFVGGSNFQLSISTGNVGAVGWFPLGPREVYRPWYSTSRRYFEQVNVSNTIVNTTVINNYYNNTNVTNVNYVNRQVPGAVVAVPTTAFVQSQPVARAAVRMTQQMVASAPVAPAAAVAPTEKSVRGPATQGDRPPARVFERQVVARRAPAAAPASFAAQQQQLEKQPGKPLDEAAKKEIQAAPAATAPTVKVVAQSQATPPTALPPPAGLNGKDSRVRGTPPSTAGANAPAEKAEKGAPNQVAQPGAATQPAERGKGQQRARQPEAPSAATQAATPPPPAAAAQPQASGRPPVTVPAEQPATAEQRGKGQPRDKDEQRARNEPRGTQPEAAPGTPPQAVAPGLQPRVSSPSQTRIQQQQAGQAEQQQARQAEQQKAREAQAAQQQARQAEQQKAREAQAAQQQARQAEQQKAREAQAAQQQARQAEQQKAREAQAAQQQASQAQAAQQQARQAEPQKAREAQAAQQQARQAEQQQARQAQAAQQQARQAEQQQARQAQAAQQQARQAQAPPPVAAAAPAPQAQQRVAPPAQGNKEKDADEQKREEEARKQKG